MVDVAYDFATTVVAALVLTGIAWLILCFVTWSWIDPFDWTGRAAFIIAVACVHFNQRGRP